MRVRNVEPCEVQMIGGDMTRFEAFCILFEPANGWKDDETARADFAAFELVGREIAMDAIYRTRTAVSQ